MKTVFLSELYQVQKSYGVENKKQIYVFKKYNFHRKNSYTSNNVN